MAVCFIEERQVGCCMESMARCFGDMTHGSGGWWYFVLLARGEVWIGSISGIGVLL